MLEFFLYKILNNLRKALIALKYSYLNLLSFFYIFHVKLFKKVINFENSNDKKLKPFLDTKINNKQIE
jgi:hypothetical protein